MKSVSLLCAGQRIWKLLIVIIIGALIWQFFKWLQLQTISEFEKLISTKENDSEEKIYAPVLVSVYYEALCPDSKSFILKQLVPAFERSPRLMNVELIPYGKAETTVVGDHYEFKCQHSYVECEANKIHSCAVHIIKDKPTLIKYVACMIANNNVPDEAGRRCASEIQFDYNSIENCATGKTGSQLLKMNGERTHALQPPVHFIPTVVLHNSQETSSLPALLKDLHGEVCKLFRNKPKECSQ